MDEGDRIDDTERWTGRDELGEAVEKKVWDRFGSFAGQPQIASTVVWTTADRRVVIEGRRGNQRFEELVRLRGGGATSTLTGTRGSAVVSVFHVNRDPFLTL